jgi:hypothetical protein
MKRKTLLIILLSGVLVGGCSLYKTAVNLTRLQFKLGNVNNFSLMGINISDKSKLSDLGAMEVMQLSTALLSKNIPVSFILNVEAKNPNSGNGYGATDIYIKRFPWKLIINNKETARGDIQTPFKVPGVGGFTTIPIRVEFNLLKFFQDNSLNDVANLVFAIGGKKGSSSNLKLIAEPVLGTPIGDIKYPQPITIINKSFK